MKWEYGNSKTNSEGRNHDRQLWPGASFKPLPVLSYILKITREPENTTATHHISSEKQTVGALKQIRDRSTAHETPQHMQMWGWWERGTPSFSQAEKESEWEVGRTLTCKTPTLPNLHTYIHFCRFLLLCAPLFVWLSFTVCFAILWNKTPLFNISVKGHGHK